MRGLTAAQSLIATLVLLTGGACDKPRVTYLTASGTTEVIQTDIAAITPARVLRIAVREGDSVHVGDTLVRLTVSALASDIEMRQARLAAAQAALRDLEAGSRPEEVDRAEAELRVAETDVRRTTSDLTRATAQLQAGAVSQAQFDAVKAAAESAVARRDALRDAVALVKAGARPERISAARSEVAAARAGVGTARATAQDLVLTAPVSGVVLARYVEEGETIGAGIPTLTIGDLKQPWVRVFVAAPALPKLHVGMEALAQVQGLDHDLFAARVMSIDANAQFTPRIALTEDERADLMFGVRMQLAPSTTLLKPGLPIDLHFDTSGTGFPASLTSGKTIHPLPVAGNGGK
jgi:HlyD family secretion protein